MRGLCKTVPPGSPVVVQTKTGPRCGVCGTGPNRLLGGRITRQFRFTCSSACGIAAHHPSGRCATGGMSTRPMLPAPRGYQIPQAQQLQLGGY